jgi:hypothetical protein
MERFRANGASASELPDLNAFAVVLSERADGTGRRLEIQKALTFDERDKASGQDTYCLCNELGATHYGGVLSWSISKGELRLELDADAQRSLGAKHGYLIEVPSEISELADGLQRLLGPQAR